MDYKEFKEQLLSLSPDSKCLAFIAERIAQENYRGRHISQHNRYDFDKICEILFELKQVAKGNKIKIRTTDLSKAPLDMPGTEQYCLFCSTLREKYGKYTQDTIRKNFFVDFARMGFINRYDNHGELIPLFKRGRCHYISITKKGMVLANKSSNRRDKYIAFSKGLDQMSNNLPFELFNLCASTEGKITRMEYTYFVSFLGQPIVKEQGNRTIRNLISEKNVVDFILEYRSLSSIHSKIDEVVKAYCTPNNFNGDKTDKRDFRNWINETEQTLKLLSTTIYFEYLSKYTTLKLRVDLRMNIDNVKGLERSSQEKTNYFIYHKVNKDDNKTLHHIVPLETWQDLEDFKLLDDWRNMLYIENTQHKAIHKLKPLPCFLRIRENNLSLSNENSAPLVFKNKEEVDYSVDNAETLIDYNSDLLNSRIV